MNLQIENKSYEKYFLLLRDNSEISNNAVQKPIRAFFMAKSL